MIPVIKVPWWAAPLLLPGMMIIWAIRGIIEALRDG